MIVQMRFLKNKRLRSGITSVIEKDVVKVRIEGEPDMVEKVKDLVRKHAKRKGWIEV